MKIDIGKRITLLREALGWSQSDLGRAAKLSRSMICTVESGKRGMSLIVASKIARAFGITLDSLLNIYDQPDIDDGNSFDEKYYIIKKLSPCNLERILEYAEFVYKRQKEKR